MPPKPTTFTTRRPTGRPSWPILLLAGAEKAGKSWACAEASGSDLIGRTLWIGVGEDDPDEYGNVPGARFEIVEHDGTYRQILAAIEWAAAQDPLDGRPNLLVVDSMTRLWDLLSDMAQDQANARARRKQQTPNSRQAAATDDVEADIHMDLWNVAKGRWANVIDALRAHQGPALLTARLEEVTVMDRGKPTQERTLKVKAEKSLPYDVAGIVQLPERGKAFLTGVKTTRMHIPERIPLPGFTVDKLWRSLGLADAETGPRRHSGIHVAHAQEPQARPAQQPSLDRAAAAPAASPGQEAVRRRTSQPAAADPDKLTTALSKIVRSVLAADTPEALSDLYAAGGQLDGGLHNDVREHLYPAEIRVLTVDTSQPLPLGALVQRYAVPHLRIEGISIADHVRAEESAPATA